MRENSKMKDQVVSLELEKQVTSLEPSKELKKLGVKQDGIYSYFQYDKWNVVLRRTNEIFSPNNECGYNKANLICSAFTVAEHGEALPGEISVFGTKYYLDMGKIDSQSIYYIRYIKHDVHDTVRKVNGKTEADVRAKMRIMLIKDKLMEVNKKWN